jgi:hypothetical protein
MFILHNYLKYSFLQVNFYDLQKIFFKLFSKKNFFLIRKYSYLQFKKFK